MPPEKTVHYMSADAYPVKNFIVHLCKRHAVSPVAVFLRTYRRINRINSHCDYSYQWRLA